jgi:uncharacterized lipoprotein YmbA
MRLALIALVLSASGCTLLTKSEPIEVVYVSPPLPAAAGATKAQAPLLRVRRVSAASHLRRPVIFATAPSVFRKSEQFQWTEEPVGYLERGLGRSLFEGGPYRRALTGEARALEVVLTRFEVDGKPEAWRAVVELHLLVHDDDQALLERTLGSSAKLADPNDPTQLARAMGKALQDALTQLVGGIPQE